MEEVANTFYATLYGRETAMLDTSTEIAVWYAVKSYAGRGICYASIRDLAKRSHTSKESVSLAVKKFIQLGLVKDLGKKKPPHGYWATQWLEVSDYRTDMSADRTQVSAGAAKVSDSTDMKDKGKRAAAMQALSSFLGDRYKEEKGIPYMLQKSGWAKIHSPVALWGKIKPPEPPNPMEMSEQEILAHVKEGSGL